MKTFSLALVFCVVGAYAAVSDDAKQKLAAIKMGCVTESGVSLEAVENAKNGVFDEKDTKLNCFSACVLKNLGLLNPDGLFNEQNFRALVPADIPKDKVDALFNKCKPLASEGGSFCEKGGRLLKCYMENKTVSLFGNK